MIFLVGHHAAGKSEIAQILKGNYNFLHFETGDIVRNYKRAYQPEVDTTSWVKLIEDLHGPRHFDQVIAEHVVKAMESNTSSFQEVLISGNRSVEGVTYLKDRVPMTYKRVPFIVYVHASPDILYRRFVSRGRDEIDTILAQSEFGIILCKEEESGLANLRCLADQVLDNDFDSKEGLVEVVRELFEYKLGYTQNKESSI